MTPTPKNQSIFVRDHQRRLRLVIDLLGKGSLLSTHAVNEPSITN
jgi:hypothetical protein